MEIVRLRTKFVSYKHTELLVDKSRKDALTIGQQLDNHLAELRKSAGRGEINEYPTSITLSGLEKLI